VVKTEQEEDSAEESTDVEVWMDVVGRVKKESEMTERVELRQVVNGTECNILKQPAEISEQTTN